MPRPKPMVSHSQNFEDVILERVFQDEAVGFYVDVGAADPHVWSLTRHFYDHGWSGINIEPGSVFENVRRARPRDVNLNVAVAEQAGTLTFQEFPDAPGLSSLRPDLPDHARRVAGQPVCREVEVLPLRAILEQHAPARIDFLSVDVEGFERAVLASNDWSRFRPRVVVVEATVPCTPTPCHHLWEDVLLGADYLDVYFDGLNRFYLRREDAALRERFQTPPNVFDHFILPQSAPMLRRLEERCAAADQHLQLLRNEMAALTRQCQIQEQQRLHLEVALRDATLHAAVLRERHLQAEVAHVNSLRAVSEGAAAQVAAALQEAAHVAAGSREASQAEIAWWENAGRESARREQTLWDALQRAGAERDAAQRLAAERAEALWQSSTALEAVARETALRNLPRRLLRKLLGRLRLVRQAG